MLCDRVVSSLWSLLAYMRISLGMVRHVSEMVGVSPNLTSGLEF